MLDNIQEKVWSSKPVVKNQVIRFQDDKIHGMKLSHSHLEKTLKQSNIHMEACEFHIIKERKRLHNLKMELDEISKKLCYINQEVNFQFLQYLTFFFFLLKRTDMKWYYYEQFCNISNV